MTLENILSQVEPIVSFAGRLEKVRENLKTALVDVWPKNMYPENLMYSLGFNYFLHNKKIQLFASNQD